MKTISRRNFIKLTSMATGAIPLFGLPDAFGMPNKKEIKIGYLQGANSVAITLIGSYLPEYKISFKSFQDIPTITTALIKNDIQVAQNIYTGFVSMVSKNMPIKAVSGQCNGGSDFVIKKDFPVEENDWKALNDLIFKMKKNGNRFTIASFFGSVQDIELRLLLKEKNIKVGGQNGDVKLLNVPYPGMMGAISTGAAHAAIPVQPFGVEMELKKIGRHFCFPYDQPAGNLTNLVLMNSNYIKNNKTIANEIVRGMVELTNYLKTESGKSKWGEIVHKYSNIDQKAVELTLDQLTPSYTIPSEKIYEMSVGMYNAGFIHREIDRAEILKYIDYDALEYSTGLKKSVFGA